MYPASKGSLWLLRNLTSALRKRCWRWMEEGKDELELVDPLYLSPYLTPVTFREEWLLIHFFSKSCTSSSFGQINSEPSREGALGKALPS
jgi:hypothetical protein